MQPIYGLLLSQRLSATPFVYSFLGSVNLFNGRVDGQTVRVGEDTLHLGAPQSLPQGADVVAFARPHELEIVTDTQTTAGVGAKVSHVLSFGVTARVELDGMHTSAGQHFEVEMTRERLAELALQEGQLVRLHPSHLKVFGAQEKEAA